MANTNCIELAGDSNSPRSLRSMTDINAKLRRSVATITLAGQASGDTINLPARPKGSRYAGHQITASVSLGTATIALGIAGTPAKYRAAAVHTAVDTPTGVQIAARLADAALTADEPQLLTVGTAALPGAGTLVIETFFVVD
jgi:hypothetical protein